MKVEEERTSEHTANPITQSQSEDSDDPPSDRTSKAVAWGIATQERRRRRPEIVDASVGWMTKSARKRRQSRNAFSAGKIPNERSLPQAFFELVWSGEWLNGEWPSTCTWRRAISL